MVFGWKNDTDDRMKLYEYDSNYLEKEQPYIDESEIPYMEELRIIKKDEIKILYKVQARFKFNKCDWQTLGHETVDGFQDYVWPTEDEAGVFMSIAACDFGPGIELRIESVETIDD